MSHQIASATSAVPRAFADNGLDGFDRAYPARSVSVGHRLHDHPLFALPALAGLAERLPANHVEHSLGNQSVDQDPANVRQAAMPVGEIVRTIADNGCWMVLKKVEADPAYAALIDQCLAEIASTVAPATGPYMRREAFIFLSSPGSVTPFHMDPEHNILLQIAGTKTMRVYCADDEAIVPQRHHEAFHLGAHRNMSFDASFDDKATTYVLEAGDGVHVPVKAPHWVQNGPLPSISFSITWRSAASDGQARLHRFNGALRKLGLTPAPLGAHPTAEAAKIGAHRLAKATTANVRRLLGKKRERGAY